MPIYRIPMLYGGRMMIVVEAEDWTAALIRLEEAIAEKIKINGWPASDRAFIKHYDPDLYPVVEFPDCPLHHISKGGRHICGEPQDGKNDWGEIGGCVLSDDDCYVTGCPVQLTNSILRECLYEKEAQERTALATRMEGGLKIVSAAKLLEGDSDYQVYLAVYCKG